jgi:hypothetical protein
MGSRDDRHGRAPLVPAYFTRIDVGWLQSPGPVLVVARYRNSTVVATGKFEMVVFACNVMGTSTHVLPPSTLYCHSYEARAPAAFAR